MSTVPDTPSPASMTLATSVRHWMQGIGAMAVWTALAFLGAGTVHWRRGWVTCAIYAGLMIVLAFLAYRRYPDLFQARADWRKHKAAPLDRFFVLTQAIAGMLQPAVAGADKIRFQRLPLPAWIMFPGVLLLVGSVGAILWVFLTNPFAETVVRIQNDRGHRVITNGPYRFVRHPMYAASIAMYIATGLMFGSGWALILSAAIAMLLVWRTGREDAYLRANLPGYAQFTTQTRYRLVPGIW